MRKKIIEKFTQEFQKKGTSKLTFLNKLKENFIGNFCIEIRDISIEISIQMKYFLICILNIDMIKFWKDIKLGKTSFEMNKVSLGYRFSK
jgi:hypothetical protein